MKICNHCNIREGSFISSSKITKKGISEYWRCRECNRESVNKYYHTKKGSKNIKRLLAIQYKKNIVKVRARAKINYHVKVGNISKPTKCSLCKKSYYRIEAHHPDYSKPLDVIWVCTPCHSVLG